jgi:hypothetical protein
MAEEKTELTPEISDFEGHEEPSRSSGKARITESVRLGLTVLTLLMAMSIVGTTADSLAVYNKTHVADDFLLPLWPVQFNLGPTIALVTGGSIIILSNTMSLIGSKVPAVRLLILIQTTSLTNCAACRFGTRPSSTLSSPSWLLWLALSRHLSRRPSFIQSTNLILSIRSRAGPAAGQMSQ